MSETTQATAGTVATLQNVGKNTIAGNAAISAMISDSLRSAADSQKVQASIFNNMIAATSDYHKSQVDEWYKTEVLKQNEQQIEIERNYKAGLLEATEQRNNILKNKIQDDVSVAQQTGATKALIAETDEAVKILSQKAQLNSLKLSGIDKDGNPVALPPAPGSTEYNSLIQERKYIESEAKKLTDKKKGLETVLFNTAYGIKTRQNVGLINNSGIEPEIPYQDGVYGPTDIITEEGSLLPNVNDGPLPPVDQPLPPNQNITESDVKTFYAADWKLGQSLQSNNLVESSKENKPVYRSTENFYNLVAQYSGYANDGKKQFPQQLVNQAFSQLDPAEQNNIIKSQVAIQENHAIGIVEAKVNADKEFGGDPSKYGDAVKNVYNVSEKEFRNQGGDIAKLSSTQAFVEAEYNKLLRSKEYKDLKVEEIKSTDPTVDLTEIRRNFIREKLDTVISEHFNSTATTTKTDAKKEEVGKSSIIKSALREDGSIGEPIIIGDKTKSDDAKRKIRISSSNDFMETFVDAQTGKLNLDFVSFVNRYAKPEDFGISIDTPLFNEFTTGEEVHSAIVKKEKAANAAKQKVLTDINAAYIFWMKKANPEKSQLLNLE